MKSGLVLQETPPNEGSVMVISNIVSAEDFAAGLEIVMEYNWFHYLLAWKEDRYFSIKENDLYVAMVILTDDMVVEELKVFDENDAIRLQKRILKILKENQDNGTLRQKRERVGTPYLYRKTNKCIRI